MNAASHGVSPDSHAAGLLDHAPDSLRYDWQGVFGPEDRMEVPAIMARWMPAGARVLDVGCGSGAITKLVQDQTGARILGVEPDPIRSDAARARGLDVKTGLMDKAFLRKNGPFDVIMFTDVLEHLPSPGEVVAAAKAGLKPGGYILASVPNVAHWSVRLRLLIGKFNYAEMGIMDATHLRWFTRKTFASLFEQAGFIVVEQSASAGVWLGDYTKLPFSLLPRGVRRRLVQSLTRLRPTLFGVQHVIKAQLL